MSLADAYPDIEKALVSGLPTLLANLDNTADTVTAGTVTTDSLEDDLPFIRVGVIDSPGDQITRRSLVNVEVFASTRDRAYALSEQVHGVLLSTRVLSGVVIDRVLISSGPKQVPWDNDNIRRFLGAYWLSTRR